MSNRNEELVIVDGCYHRYPNTTGVRYQLKLFADKFVFQARGGRIVITSCSVFLFRCLLSGTFTSESIPGAIRILNFFWLAGNLTEVRLDDVIGCHVMRFSDAHTGAGTTKDSAFFCIYAYHLAPRKGIRGGLVRQRHTYIFEVDICATYKNNLKVARKWQSAVLWLLQGHRFLVENGKYFSMTQTQVTKQSSMRRRRKSGVRCATRLPFLFITRERFRVAAIRHPRVPMATLES